MKLAEFNVGTGRDDLDGPVALLRGFNRTRTPFPKDMTVPGLFAGKAAETPGAVAVTGGDVSLSYGVLDRRSAQFAQFLVAQGLEPEALVGVMLDRRPGMVFAMLGALRAGGAYLPIHPDLPPDRIAYILRDARTPVLVSDVSQIELCRRIQAKCPDLKHLLFLDGAEDWTPALPLGTGAPAIDRSRPDGLAYTIYTSGTTGRPKGVMVEHRAILRLVRNTNYIDLDAGDRILQTGPLAFDASVFEIWGALLNGGFVCLPPKEALLDAAELGRLISRYGITTVFLTTALFNALAGGNPEIFSGLKSVLTGGEQASVHHFNTVRQRNPNLRLVHVYGPTENTTFTTFFDVRQSFASTVPIGGPISNTDVCILDGDLEPVGIGVTGELHAGGYGLARGYLNDPALTAQKFIPHPFEAGKRLYRTGDLARWLPDGNIEFLGRADDQVKIRGYRIEPAEIEFQMLRHDRVREAVVTIKAGGGGERSLTGYFTADGIVEDAVLREHLKEALPEYMIPESLVQLERLPLTANGKVDKRALPEAARIGGTPNSARRQPELETEKQLLQIWTEVLDRRDIGIDDVFFDFGGHSMKAMKLMSLINKRISVVLPFTTVFTAPTIRELAQCVLDDARFGEEGIDNPVVLLNGRDGGRPVFAFPPGTADALGYGQLAGLLRPYAFYAFNFIEAEDRLQQYADLIMEAGGDGPHLLFGYSGGGNLAFHTAKELESRGQRVARIVMLDSGRFMRKISFSDEEVLGLADSFVDADVARRFITSQVLRDKAVRNIQRYHTFFARNQDDGCVDADIHVVLCENSQMVHVDSDGAVICSTPRWAEATRGEFRTHQGHGNHNQMLYDPYLEPNVALLRGILDDLA